MTIKTEKGMGESRGYWHFERIGRPEIMYDQRSKYNVNMDEFERVMNERRKISSGVSSVEIIGGIIVEETL